MSALTDHRPSEFAPGRASIASPRHVMLALVIVILSAFLSLIGTGPSVPLDTHEAFVARTATEMLRRDEWTTPYLNDQLRLQKPPLSYWLSLTSHQVLTGSHNNTVSEFEARLPSVLAGIGLVLAAMLLAIVVFDSVETGLLAGAVTGTSLGFLQYAHNARPEMVYALFCSLAIVGLLCLYRIRRTGSRRRRIIIGVLTWLAMSGALLAKGPFLPVFILLGLMIALVLQREGRSIPRVVRPLTAIVVIAIVVVPWYALMIAQNDALAFWRGEMFDRVGETENFWWQPLMMYYVTHLPLLIAPWWGLLPFAVLLPWQLQGERANRSKIIWWLITVTIIILSFSVGRRWYYLLPLLPCMAVLLAGSGMNLHQRWSSHRRGRRLLAILVGGHGLLAAALAGGIGAAILYSERASHLSNTTAWTLACLAWLGGLIALFVMTRPAATKPRGLYLLLASLTCSVIAAQASGVVWRLERRHADRAFAQALAETVDADQPILSVGTDPAVIIYYADRIIDRTGRRRIADRLEQQPDVLILTNPRTIERQVVSGEIILSQGDLREDAFLLLRNPIAGEAAFAEDRITSETDEEQ